MAELLIILWFTLVLVLASGFTMGYLFGKARTLKYMASNRTAAEEYLFMLVDDRGDEIQANEEERTK